MFQAVLHKWWRMVAKPPLNCNWNAERDVTARDCIKLLGPRAVPARSGPHGSRRLPFSGHPGKSLRAAGRDGSRSDPELDAALVTVATLHCPCHLDARLARQAVQPDPSPRGVEVGPVFAVHLDGGNGGGGRMTQDQHHLARRASRRQSYRGHEAAVLHVGYHLVTDWTEMGRGVSHRDPLPLLQPDRKSVV